MTRVRRRLLATLVVLVAAAPGLLTLVGIDHDDYPLSTYPMFARARPQHTVLNGVVRVDVDGGERRLSPAEISGSPEPLQASSLVARAIADGGGELCRGILARVGPLDPGERLLLVRDRVDAVAHFEDRASAARDRVRSVDCSEAAT